MTTVNALQAAGLFITTNCPGVEQPKAVQLRLTRLIQEHRIAVIRELFKSLLKKDSGIKAKVNQRGEVVLVTNTPSEPRLKDFIETGLDLMEVEDVGRGTVVTLLNHIQLIENLLHDYPEVLSDIRKEVGKDVEDKNNYGQPLEDNTPDYNQNGVNTDAVKSISDASGSGDLE